MNIRKVLFPFSILYDGITSLRNVAYDNGWKNSKRYDLPVICVGNLSVGGSGKSPMVEYIVDFLRKDHRVAVLSRGYKRKSNGFIEVLISSTAEEVGDEPLQFKQKFPKVTVAVCASRQEGIEKLKAKADVIILDDALQHRKVRPSFTILLTPFDDLFTKDLVLPAGNLRESQRGARRADVIIVTKCPDGVAYSKLQEIQYEMNLQPYQRIYFSKIGYDQFVHSETESLPIEYLSDKPFTLVTGIANPKPLVAFLKKKQFVFTHEKFPDHHNFSSSEISSLKEKEILLTTEKDYMRLQSKLGKFALYYLPIKMELLNVREDALKKLIWDGVKNFRKV